MTYADDTAIFTHPKNSAWAHFQNWLTNSGLEQNHVHNGL